MGYKLYLDTNIILDLADMERTTSETTNRTIDRLIAEGSIEFSINSDTLSTSYFILVSRKKITQENALAILEKVERMCDIVPINASDVREALTLCKDSSTPFHDYEDAIQFVCARKIGADLIVTQDRGFVSDGIEILVPTL